MPTMVVLAGREGQFARAGRGPHVFLRLIVRHKILDALENLFVIVCETLVDDTLGGPKS